MDSKKPYITSEAAPSVSGEIDAAPPVSGPVGASGLGGFELFIGVAPKIRAYFVDSGEQFGVEAGDVLISPRQPAERMYFVLSGKLEVRLESPIGELVAMLEAGDPVGELALLDGGPNSAYVIATEPCQLLAVDDRVLRTALNRSPEFGGQLLAKLARRLRESNEVIAENLRKRRQIERVAMFDGLTGVHNRRWLDEMLDRMVQRHAQFAGESRSEAFSPGDLCLAIADIDNFHQYNEQHGRDAGDHVLAAVASALVQHIRPTDLVARFGGEEFIIVFSDTTLGPAMGAAERLRRAIEALEFTLPDGGALPGITISIGVAQLADEQSSATFLATADQALYNAKARGRNRVESE